MTQFNFFISINSLGKLEGKPTDSQTDQHSELVNHGRNREV